MRIPTPRVRIRHQALTTPPFIADSTLVDDPVALVDDPTALVGGQTVTFTGIRARVKVPTVRAKIRRRH